MFRATEGSTQHSPLVFGVETVLWTSAANKVGKWYRGVLEAAERFMVRWHENEAKLSKKCRASVIWAASEGMGREGGTVLGKPPLTKAGRRWQTG